MVIFSLAIIMDFSTSSARVTTFVEIRPAATAWAAGNRLVAVLTVEWIKEIGTRADATLCANRPANTPVENRMPWRANRFASNPRAVVSRLERVPSGIFS